MLSGPSTEARLNHFLENGAPPPKPRTDGGLK